MRADTGTRPVTLDVSRDNPHARPSSLVELTSGVDALYLSGHCELPKELLRALEEAREAAEGRISVPFVLGEVEFALSPGPFGRYRYRLSHPRGLVGLTASTKLPAVRVQPRAEFLHGVGPAAAVEWFDEVLRWESDDIVWQVSRVDLFSDWQGWELCGDDRDRFVFRAGRLDLHEHEGVFTGFEFGRRTTGTVCARIYDKTRQAGELGLDWVRDLWGERFDESLRALRVEFEVGRSGLREFGLDSPKEVLEHAPGVWAALTEHWLTLRTPTADATRSRWPVAPEWLTVQAATMRDGSIGLERVSRGRSAGSLRKLLPALNGYLASAAVHLGTDDIEDTLDALPQHLHAYEQKSGVAFGDRVFEKRQRAS